MPRLRRYSALPVLPLDAPSHGERDQLQQVKDDLLALEYRYLATLEEEGLVADVQCIRCWVEQSLLGNREAAEYLGEHGLYLLEHAHSKFSMAARDIQRLDDESPTGRRSTGRIGDRMNHACALLLHAQQALAQAYGLPLPVHERPLAK